MKNIPLFFLLFLFTGCGIFGDFSPPEIVSYSPSSDAKNVDKNSPIKIIFSEPMNKPATENAFSLSTPDSTVSGFFKWSDNDTTLIFYPLHPLENSAVFYVTLETSAEDKNGNNLMDKLSYKFFVNNENVQPYVVSTYPAYGSIGVSRFTNIIITFSEPVDKASLISGVSFSPDITYLLTLINNNTTAVFKPVHPLDYGTTYSVIVNSSVKDIEGNPLLQEYKFIFTVGSDFSPPELVSIRSSSTSNWFSDIINQKVEKDDSIIFTFSKSMKQTGFDSFVTFSPAISGSFSWITTNVVEFTPEENFNITEIYSVKISKGIKDVNGNESLDDYLYHFKINGTNSIPPSVIRISSADSTNWQNNQFITINPDGTYTNVLIYFSHPMNQVKVIDNISVEYVAGSGNTGANIYKFTWNSPSDNILRIDLENLDAGNIYRLKINGNLSGALDKNNNYFTNDYIIFFKT